MTTSLISLLLLAAATPNPTAIRRFGLFIGTNQGGPGRVALRYAQSDALSMERVLRDIGGLSADDRLLVFDPSREALQGAFEDLRVRVGHADNVQREVIVYYSGHSDSVGLVLPDGGHWSYAELRTAIERIPAEVRIAILDSCASGELTRLKGGSPMAPFLADVSNLVRGHAYLTSSSADEAAQESDQIGSSFFTHYFVSGLRGAADATGSGRITLTEAYQFAFRETLARTESTVAGAQHPAYAIDLVGTGDIVMTDVRKTTAGLRVGPELDGHLFIRDDAGQLVAEVRKVSGHPLDLALEPGGYDITVERGGRYFEAHLSVTKGSLQPFDGHALAAREVEPNRVRGEVSASPAGRRNVPFDISLVPPLSINGAVGGEVVNQMQLNLIAGYATALHGLALSGAVSYYSDEEEGVALAGAGNIARGHVGSVQLAGAFDYAGGGFAGLQGSGAVSIASGPTHGAQLAGAVNLASETFSGFQGAGAVDWIGGSGGGLQVAGATAIAGGDFKGVQMSGAADVAAAHFQGAQLSGAVAVAGQLSGAQISVINVGGAVKGLQLGVINVAGDSKGAQVGVINIAGHSEGVPFGLLNFIGNGRISVDLWAGDSNAANVGLKLGVKHFYGLLTAGIDPFRERVPWFLGGGFGVRIDAGPVFVSLEALSGQVGLNHNWEGNNVLSKVRVSLGWQLRDRLTLFAGVSGNVWVILNNSSPPDLSYGLSQTYYSNGRQTAVRLWPSPYVGIEF